MRYCITGGSGFIGRYFCERLTADGHDVRVLDLVEPTDGLPHDSFVRGDVRDETAVRTAFDGCDRVLHLAAAHHDFGIDRDTFFSVNEEGARVICAAMDDHGIRSACFFSTVATYGDAPEPHTEDAATNPQSPYGQSKLAGEKVFRTWTDAGNGRRCLVIRPTVTFGARNFANMYTLISQIDRGRFVIFGKGGNIKSLSYIENIVAAAMHLWDQDGRPAFDVANYIDKPDLTSIEITETVYAALGKPMPKVRPPMWLGLALAKPFDAVIAVTGKNLPISSARLKKLYSDRTKYEADVVRESGFEPPVPLKEGIRRMVEWYLKDGKGKEAVWHLPPADVVRMAP